MTFPLPPYPPLPLVSTSILNGKVSSLSQRKGGSVGLELSPGQQRPLAAGELGREAAEAGRRHGCSVEAIRSTLTGIISIIIKGGKEAAMRRCKAALIDRLAVRVTLPVAIPQDCLGSIIGAGGSMRKALETEFGVKILIDRDYLGIVRLEGNALAVGEARERLLELSMAAQAKLRLNLELNSSLHLHFLLQLLGVASVAALGEKYGCQARLVQSPLLPKLLLSGDRANVQQAEGEIKATLAAMNLTAVSIDIDENLHGWLPTLSQCHLETKGSQVTVWGLNSESLIGGIKAVMEATAGLRHDVLQLGNWRLAAIVGHIMAAAVQTKGVKLHVVGEGLGVTGPTEGVAQALETLEAWIRDHPLAIKGTRLSLPAVYAEHLYAKTPNALIHSDCLLQWCPLGQEIAPLEIPSTVTEAALPPNPDLAHLRQLLKAEPLVLLHKGKLIGPSPLLAGLLTKLKAESYVAEIPPGHAVSKSQLLRLVREEGVRLVGEHELRGEQAAVGRVLERVSLYQMVSVEIDPTLRPLVIGKGGRCLKHLQTRYPGIQLQLAQGSMQIEGERGMVMGAQEELVEYLQQLSNRERRRVPTCGPLLGEQLESIARATGCQIYRGKEGGEAEGEVEVEGEREAVEEALARLSQQTAVVIKVRHPAWLRSLLRLEGTGVRARYRSDEVTLGGDKGEIEALQAQIAALQLESFTSETVAIPAQCVAALVGRQGQNIRRLSEKHSVVITVHPDGQSVQIHGLPACLAAVKLELPTERAVQCPSDLHTPLIAKRYPGVRVKDNQLLHLQGTRGEVDRLAEEISQLELAMEEFSVEANRFGAILGPRGERLRRIEEETGCRIQLPPKGIVAPIKIASLSREAILQAKQLLAK